MDESSTSCLTHGKSCGNYRLCLLHDDRCGPYKRSKEAVHGNVEVKALDADTKAHFSFLKVKDTKGYTERSLIENRLGRELDDTGLICAFHRYTLGIGYIPKKSCFHPNHREQKKGKKANTRPAPLKTGQIVSEHFQVQYTIGEMLCYQHLKNPQGEAKPKEIEIKDPSEHETCIAEVEDDIYIPEEIPVTEEANSTAERTSQNLTACLEVSPIVPVKQKNVEYLCERTQANYRRKYQKLKKSLKEKFSEAAAPGQTEDFLKHVLGSDDSSEDEDEEIPSDL